MLTAFRSQVENGGPITVTHPDVTRYFMTVEEAVQLVIQAGALGRDGEALVLDMGEPVRIDDVARRLAAQAPRPIEIIYTGLRPGEKMHEVLFGADERGASPGHPRITHVSVPPLPGDAVDTLPDDLEDSGARRSTGAADERRHTARVGTRAVRARRLTRVGCRSPIRCTTPTRSVVWPSAPSRPGSPC